MRSLIIVSQYNNRVTYETNIFKFIWGVSKDLEKISSFKLEVVGE